MVILSVSHHCFSEIMIWLPPLKDMVIKNVLPCAPTEESCPLPIFASGMPVEMLSYNLNAGLCVRYKITPVF